MHLVCKYNRIGRLKVRCYLSIIPFHFQGKGIDNSRYQFVRIDFLHLQSRLLPVEHRHLEHLFHLKTQAFGFIIYNPRYMLEHLRRFSDRRIFQHLRRQRNGGDRSLKLMRHIIDKVVLHLRQFLLTEHDINRKNECHQQHHCKYQRRNHETDRIKKIVSSSRKMYIQYTHLRRRIIFKQGLLVHFIISLRIIIRTTIDFLSILVNHRKVKRQVYIIIIQIRFQVTV